MKIDITAFGYGAVLDVPASKGNTTYRVTIVAGFDRKSLHVACPCPAGSRKRRCRHADEARAWLEAKSPAELRSAGLIACLGAVRTPTSRHGDNP